jgi:small subunit ribosomal protein S9
MNEVISEATGRRKTSMVHVRIVKGGGNLVINGQPAADYFPKATHIADIKKPLKVAEVEGRFDILAIAAGGGKSGQAGAMRLAIARALLKWEPNYRPKLRTNGLLTRDSRVVERKKYGKVKARKRFQFSKR